MDSTHIIRFAIAWYALIAIYPIQVYDYFHLEKKTLGRGLKLLLMTALAAPFIYNALAEEHSLTSDMRDFHWGLWILIPVVYLVTLYDAITQRTRRNFITLGLHTLAFCWVAWHCFA